LAVSSDVTARLPKGKFATWRAVTREVINEMVLTVKVYALKSSSLIEDAD